MDDKGDSPQNKDENEAKGSAPPDGGWGWVCVIGCSIAHFFIGGLARSFGVIYILLQDRFSSSAALTSWIGSICNFIRSAGGK